MPRVVHFGIPVDDPERAVAFYQNVFGWEINKWDGPQEYWLATTGPDTEPGINGGLTRRQSAGDVTANTIDVPSVDEFVAKVTQNGGELVLPKTALPGIGYMAFCRDTEGNAFGLMESDPSAK
jgi:predicted enzyme related to lactoylglutathione lyase